MTTDGSPHEIQVYTDISAEWITGNNSLVANWSTNVGDLITHQVQLANQSVFTEVQDHIQCEKLLFLLIPVYRYLLRWFGVLFHTSCRLSPSFDSRNTHQYAISRISIQHIKLEKMLLSVNNSSRMGNLRMAKTPSFVLSMIGGLFSHLHTI